jgi:hypothetical protein
MAWLMRAVKGTLIIPKFNYTIFELCTILNLPERIVGFHL